MKYTGRGKYARIRIERLQTPECHYRNKYTEGYDKSAKFRLYQSLPTLAEYILVDQTEYPVEQYTKVENHQWLLTEWMGDDAVLQLQSVAIEISLKDLCKRVSFATSAEES